MSFYNITHGSRHLRRSARLLLMPVVLALMLVVVVGKYIHHQIHLEERYKQRFGSSWTSFYEKEEGSLKEAHTKMVVGIGGSIATCVLAFFIYRTIIPGHSKRSRRRR